MYIYMGILDIWNSLGGLEPPLLTWVNFNSSMDKWSHAL